MKLVWLAQDLHIGGGQRVICELSAKLAQRGHDIEILYPRGRHGFKIPFGVNSRACGIEIASPLTSLIINIPAMIAAIPLCDWVLCSMPISTFSGFVAARLRGARALSYAMNDERALFDDRSLIQSEMLLELYHFVADLSHKLPLTYAVNSGWTATRLRHGRGAVLSIIPHGVDPLVFSSEGPRLHKEKFTIACVGRRHRWKGLQDLIQALDRVSHSVAAGADFELWIISQDDLDLTAAQFPTRVIKPSSDREIAAAYRAADLLVHPSWFEGFGLPPLEAMACGTACVVTESGGVSEFARPDVNCLMVPPRDPVALSKAITTLIQNDSLRHRLAEAGPATAAQFTWDRAADALESILKMPR
jgi:glycosyltransferase involved in cell wall biosynthesis